VDQTLYNVLVEVLLYIEVAMALAVGCQPEDTYCQCCFVLTGEMYFAKEVASVDVTVVKVLAPRADIPTGEGVLLPVATLPEVLFLVQSVAI
jgi:hypothetical protein